MRMNPDGSGFIDGIRLTATQIAEIKNAKPGPKSQTGWWVMDREEWTPMMYLGRHIHFFHAEPDVVHGDNNTVAVITGRPRVLVWGAFAL